MTNVSNMYAAKLYSEHPVGIWPIDDDFPYISLITDQQRTFEAASPYVGWTITNGTANDSLNLPNTGSPFDSSIYAGIEGDAPLSDGIYIEAKSPSLSLFSEISEDLETFCLSMYVYQNSTSAYITQYEIGYEWYNLATSSYVEEYVVIPSLERRGWIHLQETFTFNDFNSNSYKIIFRAKVNEGANPEDYRFVLNGITVGQWSEPFTSKSLGANLQIAPESSGLTNKVVSSDQYGILSDNAYFVCENGNALAKNHGIPMIFGSENVTKIYPSLDQSPSFIFPNKNFFTANGIYKDYTLEFWLKIRPSTKESRRIAGPIDNNDGIYVSEGFITLVIDGKYSSHNVSYWYRPMLVHISIKGDTFSMLINGEQVAQIKINKSTVVLSQSEWLGFYSYSDIDLMEIDCISIFPYAIPLQVSRKRFVWGQGTDQLELLNDSFDGEEAIINFANANYSVNKVYPDMERWDAGYYNNLIATTNSISVPEYSLPTVYLGGRGVDEWYEDNNAVNDAEYPAGTHPKFFTFRPNQSTRTNLITNPSFEVSTTSWLGNGGSNIAISTSDKYVGTASCLVTQVGVNYSGIILSPSSVSVIPGQVYTLSVYVKGVSSSQPLILNVHQLNSVGGIVTQNNSGSFTLLSTQGWIRKTITFTISPGVSFIRPMMMSPGLAIAGYQFYVDGFLLEQSSTLLPYFDGSYAEPEAKAIETFWGDGEGTPNASTSTMTYWTTEGTNWTEQCYLNFPSLSFLSAPLSAIYGIFEVESEVVGKRPLIHIVNTLTGKRFEINITGYDVSYEFDGQELAGTGFTVDNSHFAIGFHMSTISESFNYELATFFGSPEALSMFVGGDGASTFEGKIYRIGFSDQSNYALISEHFQENGIVDSLDEALLEGHFASYTLSPFFKYGTFFLDISISSQWEEYFPLSSFASYVKTRDGGTVYDLDYLQFNLGYPSIISITETETDNPNWTYQELFESYNAPIQKSYSILDNSVLTSYTDYADLSENIITEYQIDASQSSLDAYITFQLLAEGANEPLSSFTNTKALTDSYTVYADEENTSENPYAAYKTKFSVIDGTVIYPPKTINFKNVAMVVHFQIEQDGIISNPLKVKNLEITSKNLNQNELTAIATKTGIPIYPYVKTGIYYSGKAKNPVMLGKQNLPYLYLAENTGIKILTSDTEIEYGSIVPINRNKSDNYLLGAFHLFMKYDIFQNVSTTQTVFSLTHKGGDIEFTLSPDETSKRLYLSARDKRTKAEYPGISFYQNGIKVLAPYIEKYDWNVVAFAFEEPLDMSLFSGSLNLFFGCTYSNISFFKSTGLNEFGVTIPRSWSEVYYGDQDIDPGNIVDWEYWYNQNGLLDTPNKWNDVYSLENSKQFSTTPKEIYETYMGTNIIIIDDNSGMSIVNDQFSAFSSTVWTEPSFTLKPL